MTSVWKGKGLPVVTEDMRTAEDSWKAEYFNQIEATHNNNGENII